MSSKSKRSCLWSLITPGVQLTAQAGGSFWKSLCCWALAPGPCSTEPGHCVELCWRDAGSDFSRKSAVPGLPEEVAQADVGKRCNTSPPVSIKPTSNFILQGSDNIVQEISGGAELGLRNTYPADIPNSSKINMAKIKAPGALLCSRDLVQTSRADLFLCRALQQENSFQPLA